MHPLVPNLTKKQIEAVDLARQGLLQTEIAEQMNISTRQVYRVLGDARRILGVKTNHELVAKAISQGLLPDSSDGKK